MMDKLNPCATPPIVAGPGGSSGSLASELAALVAGAQGGQASAQAFAALRAGVAHPEVLMQAAKALEAERRRTLVPADAFEMWRRYGGLLARRGLLDAAGPALDIALALVPDDYPTLVDAGTAAFMMADLASAERHLGRASALRPNESAPLASLAAAAARQQRPREAREFAERAMALGADTVTLHLAIARADLSEGLTERSEARLTAQLERAGVSDANRVALLDLRAEARDAQGHVADAFADYTARNAILERTNAARIAQELPERRIDQARRLARHFAGARADAWQARSGTDTDPDTLGASLARGHVFLLGFPRSGTTLIEKALASHPDFVALEEVDHLAAAGGHLLANEDGLQGLERLTPAEAQACRATYWRGVGQTLGDGWQGRFVVDKMPLHTVALPLIARLFPDARILFALRDPRDVVFSCFRRRFQINAAMFELLTLEGAARYYDAVMTLARTGRALLPVAVHEVRHEAMVTGFETEVRAALGFIGADWNTAVHDFAARAGATPHTPSDLQLRRGLNAEGVGQWRRYEAQLAPVRGLLDPWAAHFGYALLN